MSVAIKQHYSADTHYDAISFEAANVEANASPTS